MAGSRACVSKASEKASSTSPAEGEKSLSTLFPIEAPTAYIASMSSAVNETAEPPDSVGTLLVCSLVAAPTFHLVRHVVLSLFWR